jgi:hypothetical protein
MTRDVPSMLPNDFATKSKPHCLFAARLFQSITFRFFTQLVAMSSAWYDEAIAPDGNLEDGCRPEEAQALRLYLDNKIEVQEAARLITMPIECSQDPGADLPNLWGVLQDALIELPNVQPKVVHLLQSMRELPTFDLGSLGKDRSGPLKNPSSSLGYDLPSFANQWYDTNWWYYQNQWRDNPNLFESTIKVDQIVNLARSEALLAQTDILGERVQYEGLSRLCDTLEDSKAVLEVELYAVREWLLNAYDLLHTLSQTPRVHYLLYSNSDIKDKIAKKDMHPAVEKRRNLWSGPGGTSPGRWNFWKERLQDIQGCADLDESTKKGAREALSTMR